jgi:hypothetical protein
MHLNYTALLSLAVQGVQSETQGLVLIQMRNSAVGLQNFVSFVFFVDSFLSYPINIFENKALITELNA